MDCDDEIVFAEPRKSAVDLNGGDGGGGTVDLTGDGVLAVPDDGASAVVVTSEEVRNTAICALPEEIQKLIMDHYLMGLRKRLNLYERYMEAEWAWETDHGNYGYHDMSDDDELWSNDDPMDGIFDDPANDDLGLPPLVGGH